MLIYLNRHFTLIWWSVKNDESSFFLTRSNCLGSRERWIERREKVKKKFFTKIKWISLASSQIAQYIKRDSWICFKKNLKKFSSDFFFWEENLKFSYHSLWKRRFKRLSVEVDKKYFGFTSWRYFRRWNSNDVTKQIVLLLVLIMKVFWELNK